MFTVYTMTIWLLFFLKLVLMSVSSPLKMEDLYMLHVHLWTSLQDYVLSYLMFALIKKSLFAFSYTAWRTTPLWKYGGLESGTF